MTTTELIDILKQNEFGGITHKPREISLTVNGEFISKPIFSVSSTGDGICGAEIDLEVNGDSESESVDQENERLKMELEEVKRERDELKNKLGITRNTVDALCSCKKIWRDKIKTAEAERDSAINDLKKLHDCRNCEGQFVDKWLFLECENCEDCPRHDCLCYNCKNGSHWKWIGIRGERYG